MTSSDTSTEKSLPQDRHHPVHTQRHLCGILYPLTCLILCSLLPSTWKPHLQPHARDRLVSHHTKPTCWASNWSDCLGSLGGKGLYHRRTQLEGSLLQAIKLVVEGKCGTPCFWTFRIDFWFLHHSDSTDVVVLCCEPKLSWIDQLWPFLCPHTWTTATQAGREGSGLSEALGTLQSPTQQWWQLSVPPGSDDLTASAPF
jgi:hypothetical protein